MKDECLCGRGDPHTRQSHFDNIDKSIKSMSQGMDYMKGVIELSIERLKILMAFVNGVNEICSDFDTSDTQNMMRLRDLNIAFRDKYK